MWKSSHYISGLFVKVKSFSHVRLCDPVDCSLPGFHIHGIFQARVPEWGAIGGGVIKMQVLVQPEQGETQDPGFLTSLQVKPILPVLPVSKTHLE